MGGHCLIAWSKVCRPHELGGLGISDLKSLGWALRVRWLWLQKTEPDRPWSTLPFRAHNCVQALFSMAVETVVGDGTTTLFWKDRWLHGMRIEDLAPRLLSFIPERKCNQRTVKEAVSDGS